jgi:Tfp pilus assembly protein PilX
VDEARTVLARLERIEALERDGAPGTMLLEEVRSLLREAEEWVRAEPAGTDLARAAVERCREALEDVEIGTGRPQDSGNVARKKPHDGPLGGSTSA